MYSFFVFFKNLFCLFICPHIKQELFHDNTMFISNIVEKIISLCDRNTNSNSTKTEQDALVTSQGTSLCYLKHRSSHHDTDVITDNIVLMICLLVFYQVIQRQIFTLTLRYHQKLQLQNGKGRNVESKTVCTSGI